MGLAREERLHGFPGWVVDSIGRRGRVVIRSQGRSMQPAIPDGASVEVRPAAFDELRVGDVVVFHYAGDVFCHRLIRKVGRFCILKGDTLLAADPPIAWPQVIGRVTTVIDKDLQLTPLDCPRQRRQAAWRARLSYPYALAHSAATAARRLTAWPRGVRFVREG